MPRPTISAPLPDATGYRSQGATVVLAATGTGNTLTQPVGTTNASGVATGSLSSTAAESKTVSATINAVAVTQTATVEIGGAPVSAPQTATHPTPPTTTGKRRLTLTT